MLIVLTHRPPHPLLSPLPQGSVCSLHVVLGLVEIIQVITWPVLKPLQDHSAQIDCLGILFLGSLQFTNLIPILYFSELGMGPDTLMPFIQPLFQS